MKRCLAVLIFLAGGLPTSHGQNSVLSEGQWFRLGIVQSGIYKIDGSFLQNLGIDISTVDPRTIKVYGNGGGGILPQQLEIPRAFDLLENPVLGEGTQDGNFDDNDYFLFYGNSPDHLSWNGERWEFAKNIYSDTTYYFLTYGGVNGKRLDTQDDLGLTHEKIRAFRHVTAHELDEKNILRSGRKWYGDEMTKSTSLVKVFEIETPNALDSAFLEVDVMVRAEKTTLVKVLYNDEELGVIPIDSIRTDEHSTYDLKGFENSQYFKFDSPGENSTIQITLEDAGITSVLFGYIDRWIFSYIRELKFDGQPLIFLSPGENTSPYTYEISTDIEEIRVWDITDPTSVKTQGGTLINGSFTFGAMAERRFVAFTGSDFPYPTNHGVVTNQNIKSLKPADGLIITTSRFKPEAERLRAFHENHDLLDIEVVTVRQIYNEFSSGMQDVTAIRDAIKYYYDQNPGSFRYALLFGDCSYDYKDRIHDNTNFVPIYESGNSLDPVATYSSDDYFGFMEPHEGEWSEGNAAVNHSLEIGIGRLPVRDLTEAKYMVDKIIRYSTSDKVRGKWKNNITYVVDDGDRNIHVADAEDLSAYLNEFQGQTILNKLYIDAFEQVFEGNTQQVPQLNESLLNAIKQGTFLINYLGHGSEERWAQETVFDHAFIDQLKNRYKLPVFLTATCEFGRYDDPNIQERIPRITNRLSGAEKLILNPDGGAIALLTTSRPVFAFSNFFVNAAFHSFFFDRDLRLGDITRLTKNNSLSGVRNRNFSLLGDPMLKLSYPQFNVEIESINNKAFDYNESDTLSALESVEIHGRIVSGTGELVDNFNGNLTVSVFDRQTQKMTFGQESDPFPFTVRENRLFNGDITVENGEFLSNFILPKNISYRFEQGKITFYAKSSDASMEATGFASNILIGGSDPSPDTDTTPPEITMYFNDSTFVNGGIIGSSSLFVARVFDESGINISGLGISQDIKLTLNDTLSYILNNYYTAEVDSYQYGKIAFPINNLEPGQYSAQLKIWDIHNNSSIRTVDFIVSDQPKIRLFNVTNYPNPAKDNVAFRFEHDRTGETLYVDIKIFNVKGAEVMTERFRIDESPRQIDELDLLLPSGKFNEGMYFYRMTVTSENDQARGEEIKRLLIIK